MSCSTGRAPFYRPKLLLWKGNVYTSVCQEFCPQDGGGCIPACNGADTPLPLGRHPRADTRPCPVHAGDTDPHPPSACWDTPPPPQATAAVGTHLPGMHSCQVSGIGGSRGGPNSFIFMQFSAKKLVSTFILGVGADIPSGKSWTQEGIGGSRIFQMGAQPPTLG